MVNDLKEVFKKHSLKKLKTLKFTFTDEDLVPNLNDFDVDSELDSDLTFQPLPPEKLVQDPTPQFEEEEYEEYEETTETISSIEHAAFLDENGNPIQPTEEELELMEEEARANRNRQYL